MRFWSPSELRNGVKNWKEITPEPLHKAIEALRRKFAENAWKAGEIMRQGCHPGLHRGMADQARTISDGIKKLGYPALPTVDEGQAEPMVFTVCFDRCAELLAKEVRRTFSDLFDIASAQSALLSSDPVDWASLQTKVLVADESHRIPLWTKDACDKQPYDPSGNPDEAIHWAKWRAPKWFFMQPFASWPYDRATAWERMNEAESKQLLEEVEDRFNQRLIMALEKAVDENHVRLAKQASRVGMVTQSLAPSHEVGGLGARYSVPKATQIPPDFMPYFPNHLKPKTQVVLAEAIRKFPEQKQTLELCRYVISEMTPVFRAAVEAGTIKPEQAFSESGMGGLLHSLLVYNCDRDNERFRLGQEARRSDEWLRLAREIDGAQLGNRELHQQTPQEGDRRANVGSTTDAFSHSEDYRSVTLRSQNFTLTSRQAQVIQILDENRGKGHADVGKDYILERLETPNSRLRDTFKSNLDAWRALIKPGSTKGTFRLNA